MEKYFILFLLSFLFSNILLYSQQFSFPGDGSVTYPYEIWSIEHWNELSDSSYNYHWTNPEWTTDKHFCLMQNIYDIRQPLYSNIRGYFYGNTKILTVDMEFPPLGALDYGGIIDNIIVEGCIFTDDIYTSGIIGNIQYSSIIRCINNTTIICTDDGNKYGMYGKGGIASYNRGTISYCTNNGSVSGVDIVGGIAAINLGEVSNCINTSKITASNSGSSVGVTGIGGIIAVSYSDISHCINLGNIEGANIVSGVVGSGLPAFPSASFSMLNCINTGYIKGNKYVGGIFGFNYNNTAPITNCINTGVIEGVEGVGSIVGKE